MTSVEIYAEQPEDLSKAQELAAHLGAQLLNEDPGSEMVLRFGRQGLALTGEGLSLRGDFSDMKRRLRHNNLSHELIVKAAKIKNPAGTPVAVDATAGMGQDSLLLAAAGFEVQLYEKNPVIAALLQDALCRAAQDPELAPIVGRMHFHEEDSLAALQQPGLRADVVVLDPMFPERQKSGLVKKKFQLLHHLELPCDDEKELLSAAIAAHPRKIIIKRPLKGPCLAGIKPSYSLRGKSIRYDCIVTPDSGI